MRRDLLVEPRRNGAAHNLESGPFSVPRRWDRFSAHECGLFSIPVHIFPLNINISPSRETKICTVFLSLFFSDLFFPAPMEGGAGSNRRGEKNKELFHVIHKVPAGDTPYVRAKHLQLVEKDSDAAIIWFWRAINAGDRVDSALKDMAVMMKQQDRAEEAIEAIKSFRHLCSNQAQESLDNLLIDFYKKCGMVEEQIELLKQKLRKIYLGEAFNGKTTKTARSHGKKFQVSLNQETARVLGNLGWAYMQRSEFAAAEAVYRKAQVIDPDTNKACNLGICLMRRGDLAGARRVLLDAVAGRGLTGCGEGKAESRAMELLWEMESQRPSSPAEEVTDSSSFKSRRLPIFEEISTYRNQMAC